MATQTWAARDLPALCAVVDLSDEGAWHIEPEQISERTGFDVETVKAGLWALTKEYPTFFEYTDTGTFEGRDIDGIRNPTGHVRRTVGTWPKQEDRVTEMVAALREAAERESDPEKRSVLRKAAEYAAGVGRDLFVGIIAGSIIAGID